MMKKALSLLLAAVLLLAVAAPAFAATGTKTDALITRLNNAKEVTVSLKAGNVPLLGSASNATDTIYIKGNKIAYEYKLAFLTARVVVVDNTAYGYLPLLPLFYVKMNSIGLGGADIWQLIKTASGITTAVLNYVKSYEVTEDGVTYYVEEHNDRATVTSKFYYVGDQLKKLVVTDAANGSTQVTTFEKIEFSAPDAVFAVPTGIDLSTFLLGLFTGGLQALAGA